MFFCFGFPATKKSRNLGSHVSSNYERLKPESWHLCSGTPPKNCHKIHIGNVNNQKKPLENPPNGGFLKWWYPTTMGFPTKNDHFGVFRGYHHLRQHPYDHSQPRNPSFPRFLTCALRFVVIFRTSRCGGKQPLRGGHTPPLPEWRSWKVHRDLKTTLNNLSGPHLKTNPTQILM